MLAKFIRSVKFCFHGISYLFRTQQNARIQLVIGIIACGMGAWLGISREDWLILVLTIVVVLMAEAFNTALEALVDLASPEIHPVAKAAKDVGAAAVLISAIGAIVIGVLIFGPLLLKKW
jgi:diacylglycerol kinase